MVRFGWVYVPAWAMLSMGVWLDKFGHASTGTNERTECKDLAVFALSFSADEFDFHSRAPGRRSRRCKPRPLPRHPAPPVSSEPKIITGCFHASTLILLVSFLTDPPAEKSLGILTPKCLSIQILWKHGNDVRSRHRRLPSFALLCTANSCVPLHCAVFHLVICGR